MKILRKFISKIPQKEELEKVLHSFSKREWALFILLSSLVIISSFLIVLKINSKFLIQQPAYGGSITEGALGTPRFINPVLAPSDSDRDQSLTTLVYSGLMKNDGTKLIPDLAESYTVTDDGLMYTFTLKEDLVFHDNKPLTADDIVFTIETIKNPDFGSPKRNSWDGVNVEKIDSQTVLFSLRGPYASFFENNTTQGILPKHLWEDISKEQFSLSNLNIEAVGSGPYEIRYIKKKSSGAIESISLKNFKKYALGKPFIENLIFKFYDTEDELISAFNTRKINMVSSISPEKVDSLTKKNRVLNTAILPRVFGIFFNQNQNPIFVDKNIIKALDLVIDKDRIVDIVLGGYGTTSTSPIPKINKSVRDQRSLEEKTLEAQEVLEKAGWEENEEGLLVKGKNKDQLLSFSISTGNTPELKATAEMIKEDLEKIGISVELKFFETGTLNQSVIRPREYDSLLFGQIVSHESDLYSFWHSSKRNDPGLNIALYTNSKADQLLEDALVTIDKEKRTALYNSFEEEIKKDSPAIFLYSPSFVYLTPEKLKTPNMNYVKNPAERFLNVNNWFIRTEKVWPIFKKD